MLRFFKFKNPYLFDDEMDIIPQAENLCYPIWILAFAGMTPVAFHSQR